jgi:ABC-type cobalamin/Fe3+-siderophores transport system ATPase subunit
MEIAFVAILNDGRIAQAGSPDEAITDKNLQAAYEVDIRVDQLEDGRRRNDCFPEPSESIGKSRGYSEPLN